MFRNTLFGLRFRGNKKAASNFVTSADSSDEENENVPLFGQVPDNIQTDVCETSRTIQPQDVSVLIENNCEPQPVNLMTPTCSNNQLQELPSNVPADDYGDIFNGNTIFFNDYRMFYEYATFTDLQLKWLSSECHFDTIIFTDFCWSLYEEFEFDKQGDGYICFITEEERDSANDSSTYISKWLTFHIDVKNMTNYEMLAHCQKCLKQVLENSDGIFVERFNIMDNKTAELLYGT